MIHIEKDFQGHCSSLIVHKAMQVRFNLTKEGIRMKRIPKLIKFPTDLVQRIEMYRKNENISTFSGAVYALLRKGLQGTDKDNAR